MLETSLDNTSSSSSSSSSSYNYSASTLDKNQQDGNIGIIKSGSKMNDQLRNGNVCRDRTNSLDINNQTISNNDYLDNNNLNGQTMDQTKVQVPDSTTQGNKEKAVKQYVIGQDVLVDMGGCFYLGTINNVDTTTEKCLVKFFDNTLRWFNYAEVKALKTGKTDSGPLCVVCKTSEDKEGDKVIVCDKCGRGYHQKCHTPKVLNLNVAWNCRRCVDQTHYIRKLESRNMRREVRRTSTTNDVQVSQKQLPYDKDSLIWDQFHRRNEQQIYCYCGTDGDWFRQMLQCLRCKQWFHEKCIGCLQYPLYCGDRFYIFVCSNCNYGNEYLRRFAIDWVDLVHLLIFNLTVYNHNKYYDLDAVILPYAHDNWHALQLSAKMKDMSLADMREQIMYALLNNKNRFKCGREVKKKVTIWGLREKNPPPAPCIALSFSGVVTDSVVDEACKGNKKVQLLERSSKTSESTQRTTSNPYAKRPNIVPLDSNMLSIMMGKTYCQNGKYSDSDSVCTIDDSEDIDKNDDVNIPDVKIVENNSPDKKDELKLILKIDTSENKLIGSKKRKNLRRTVREDKAKSVCPPTPPTSVSAPPTPPASNSNDANYYVNDNSNKGIESMDTDSAVQLKSMFDSLKSMRYDRCDSSDETSSRCTLDSIIPPPKNFRGKNNPFHSPPKNTNPNLLKGKNKFNARKRKSVATNLFDTNGPVVRTLKRKLSEKDLIIGENGEVKRRRFRRSRGRSSLPEIAPLHSTETKDCTLRSSLNAPPSSISNCVDYALNGRRLRQRPDITYTECRRRNSTNSRLPTQVSPISQMSTGKVSDVCMTDLKSSVNVYFGATNRILNGEKFIVQGKRVNADGKIQYLIEWEGGPS